MITLGMVVGIIVGLYFNIVPFTLCGVLFYLSQYIIKKKYRRFIRLFITKKMLILFCISFLLGNRYIVFLEMEYERIYQSLDKMNVIGVLISEKEEKEYSNRYKIRVEKINGKQIHGKVFLLSISKNKNKVDMENGDKVYLEGEYIRPEGQRNEGGFDYSRYLKTLKIYGTIKVDSKIKIIEEKEHFSISTIANHLKSKMIKNANHLFLEETKGIFLGILLGYTDFITDEVKEELSDSSLSHLLAVSGAHVSYIILGLTILFRLIKIPKKAGKILSCILLYFYLYITDFTPSVTRAVIMGIIVTLQAVLYRKQDTVTTISFSVLLILVENPYKIFNIGFLLSYLGTIGIIAFVYQIQRPEETKKNIMYKITLYLKNACIVTMAAQICIFPIMVYYFNIISFTFIISNVLAGILIGPITIIGFIVLILSFFSLSFTSIIVKFYNILLILLLDTTKIVSNIPFSKVYVKTPPMILIVLYYLVIILLYMLLLIQKSKRTFLKNKMETKIKRLKEKVKNNYTKYGIVLFIFFILFFVIHQIPRNLRVYFIDVGQGDSCLIVTPTNKRILIDSGGNENYDVGKNTVLPYLLDRGVTRLDYILISHFDTDHCKGFEYILENIKVHNMIISKQAEITENFKTIYHIAQRKNINIMIVSTGDIIHLDKYSQLEIFAPDENNKSQNMNDSSIITKLKAYHFSVLFTGDASQSIEQTLIANKNIDLSSTVLKISHHGSNTGTSQEFLERVKPSMALIGVGKNNQFGHPSQEVIKRLESKNIQIYRTDEMGEIKIIVNQKGKVKVRSAIND